VWILIPCDRIRGLDASPRGIPTTTSSFGLEYILGCLKSVARALGHVRAHPGSSLTLLLEGSCRTLVKGQLSFPQGLGFYGRAPEPRAHEVDQSSDPLLCDPHAPFRKKEEGWRMPYYPHLGASSDDLR
jgi:hypothetical protein